MPSARPSNSIINVAASATLGLSLVWYLMVCSLVLSGRASRLWMFLSVVATAAAAYPCVVTPLVWLLVKPELHKEGEARAVLVALALNCVGVSGLFLL